MEKEKLKEIIFAAIALAALNEQGDREHREEQKNPAEAKRERERAILPTPCTVGFDDCTVKDWFQKIGGRIMAKNKKELKFELGKYYKHTSGKMINICGVCSTKTYGMCLMAEKDNGNFYPVGNHEGATDGWHEIKEEEFLF